MSPSFISSLVVSRGVLIAAVLLGQWSGASGCCCWMRFCVHHIAGAVTGSGQDASEGEKVVCPKCLAKLGAAKLGAAKLNKLKSRNDSIDDTPCRCSGRALIALGYEPKSDPHPRCESPFNAVATHNVHCGSIPSGCSSLVRDDAFSSFPSWSARACIWRI